MTAGHVVVTGGASGIGRAVVRRLARRGETVTVLDADACALAHLADVRDEHPRVRVTVTDVTDAAAVRGAFEEAANAAGMPDGLVCCAGVKGQRRPALDLDDQGWRHLLATHLFGTWGACRAFATLRQAAPTDDEDPLGPAVVTVSSIVAAGAFSGQLDYGTAKAAVEHLTKVLAVEWAPLGIRVNAVAPGFTRTPMVAALQSEGYDLEPVERRTPMGRLAEPDETAAAIEFLLRDAAFVTGTVLPVDGGWTAVGR